MTTSNEENYKVDSLQGSANYRTWKFSMRMVLQAKELWEVVSGEEEKPESGKAAENWEKKSRKALALIALALSALEEEKKVDPGGNTGITALLAKNRKADERDCHYCGQEGHWKRDCPVRKYRAKKGSEEHPKYSL